MDDLEPIKKVLHSMFDREKEFAEATLEVPAYEHAHKVKRAVEYLKADGTIKDKEARAEQLCEKEYLERLRAEARAVVAKEKLLDARAALSALQTIHRNQS